MNFIGIVHVSCGLLSLIFGAVVFLRRKGTQIHRMFGYIYVISMLGLNITAMMIYKVFHGFGPFHVFALTSLVALVVGFVPVYFKKPPVRWLTNHYRTCLQLDEKSSLL